MYGRPFVSKYMFNELFSMCNELFGMCNELFDMFNELFGVFNKSFGIFNDFSVSFYKLYIIANYIFCVGK